VYCVTLTPDETRMMMHRNNIQATVRRF